MQRFQKISRKVADKLNQSKVGATVLGGAMVATQASADAIVAPDFTEPIANVAILLGSMLGFGAIVWGGRKLLGFIS
ncbi:MAG: hypothetical protein ACJAWW_000148 [Sulfurimonas sp.]|jgi:hypothetical protein